MDEHKTDPMAEITAMQKLAEAFSNLNSEAITRVLRWAADHYAVSLGATTKPRGSAGGSTSTGEYNGTANGITQPHFNDLAELYTAASPSNDADRALVVGYWYQFIEGLTDFAAQAINSALKNLGHGVSNITSAFDTLKAQKPALVIQVKKGGTTKQARKKYKLTAAGKNAVDLLIGHH